MPTIERPDIACWGDSAFNTQAPVNQSIVNYLRRISRRQVLQFGVGGETATQTAARFTASPTTRHATAVIFTGHNSYLTGGSTYVPTGVADIQAAIAAMIAYLGHERYIVLGNLAGIDGEYNPIAVQVRADKAAFTAWNNTTHLTKARDPLAVLQAYDPSDRLCRIDNRMPLSLAADDTHTTAVGNSLIAQDIYDCILSQGW